mgnify:CR=1 FL=1
MVDIMSALNMIFVPMNLLGLFLGVLVGIAFGCMPGLSVNMGLALLFPLAFTFHGIGGILMLLGIYCGAIYGGSISAILLKTPGTPASVATTLDGYPMATKLGQPGRALGLSTLASTFGGIFSTICLIFAGTAAGEGCTAVFQAGIFCSGYFRPQHYYECFLRQCYQGYYGRSYRSVPGDRRH